MKQQRIGIFGGTFDPPHLGHLIAAQLAAELLRLDPVLVVPAGRPPHKRRRALAAPGHRLAMVRLAIAGNPLFACSDIELRPRGPSYTADTLAALARRHPAAALHLLIGLDQAVLLPTWHNPRQLFEHAKVCVLARPGSTSGAIPRPWRRRIRKVPVSLIDISASAIRRRAARRLPIGYLVPPAVAAYIAKHRLYQR
ncbi:MAG TPA: nicotinate-nucleotide adenylyltransferase [Candidatus Edwardsbacteria bacterium]|nr:nicotinate-nucleotide adenylyltransferase [Candidatus Edwardsbacteria bacterium]